MAATSFVDSEATKTFKAFIAEMSNLYNNAENADIKEINEKAKLELDERAIKAMDHVRYVTYDKYKIALCVFEGMLWIDVCMLTQHLTSRIDSETQKIIHPIELALVYARGTKRPFLYEAPIHIQIDGLYKSVHGMFVPIDQLMYYCSPYPDNFAKFISKKFKLGDSEGYMYFNVMKSGKKYCEVKVGRSIDIKGRTSGHKSDTKKRNEHIHLQFSIPVTQQQRAEKMWKDFIKVDKNLKNMWKDCPQKLELFNSINKKSEWLKLSRNEDTANAQLNLLIECWEKYITSEDFKLIKNGEQHIHALSEKEALELEALDLLEESQNEEPKESSTETSEESQHEEDAESSQ